MVRASRSVHEWSAHDLPRRAEDVFRTNRHTIHHNDELRFQPDGWLRGERVYTWNARLRSHVARLTSLALSRHVHTRPIGAAILRASPAHSGSPSNFGLYGSPG